MSLRVEPEIADLDSRIRTYHTLHFLAFRQSLASSVIKLPENLHEAVTCIARLQLNDVIEFSSPFFWFNLRQILSLEVSPDSPLVVEKNACHLVASAIDCLASKLSPECRIPNLSGCEIDVCFPTLGFALRHQEADACEAAPDIEKLLLFRTLLRSSRIDENWQAKAHPVLRFDIPGVSRAHVLADTSPSILDPSLASEVVADHGYGVELARQLGEAIALIGEIWPELHEALCRRVTWYVPIRKPSPDVHCSFTSAQQGAVIFLSTAPDPLRLAEAIVHEFSHIKLNVVAEIEGLSTNPDPQDLYSPWRPDPRPLHGLIHALFVFIEVDKFLSRCQAIRDAASYLTKRQRLIRQRLMIGREQVPEGRLSRLGLAVFSRICDYVDGLNAVEDCVAFDSDILGHLNTWRSSHPDLHLRGFAGLGT